jgi:hypothetical protein
MKSTKIDPLLNGSEDIDSFRHFASPVPIDKKASSFNVLFFFILSGILVFTILNSIALVGLYFLYNSSSSSNRSQTLIQLNDGKTAIVTPVDNNVRSPEVIKRFVATQIANLLSWSVQLSNDPTQGGKPIYDIGVEVTGLRSGTKKRVPTPVWQASFAFSEDFRPGILSAIAELVPPQVFSADSKSVLIIKSISTPEEIEKGRWKLNLVSDLITFTSANQGGQSVSFNKQIFVQAIDLPIPKPDTSPLEDAIFKVRSLGLEIYAMRDLAREDLK